jgi:8-oxo-dGTP pyrophosphatase MutT (NUDIX family)
MDTLKKEVNEELGVGEKNLDIMEIFDSSISNFKVLRNGSRYPLMLIVYRCSLSSEDQFKLSDEHSEYRWANVDEAKELLKKKFPAEFIGKLDSLR